MDLSSGIAKKREREEDPTILLVPGRDDLSALGVPPLVRCSIGH